MHAILNDHMEKYLEGRLPADIQASFDSHLEECHSCRETLSEAMESSQLLKLLAAGADDPAPEPTPSFAVKVMQGIEGARPVPFWLGWGWSIPMLRQLAVAAAMLLVLAGGYALTLQATTESTTAQLLFDMPVEHEAPLLAAHKHVTFDDTCLKCWKHAQAQAKVVTTGSDSHANREQAMAALVSGAE